MTDQLLLNATGLDPERLQRLTRSLCRDLSAEHGYSCRLPEQPSSTGEKGDPITLGAILVTLAKTGTLLGFIRLIQSYVTRVPSLELNVVRHDGSRFTLKAANLSEEQLHSTQRALEKFWTPPLSS
jgi:hypothetical protein